jgi:hypothetical protein
MREAEAVDMTSTLKIAVEFRVMPVICTKAANLDSMPPAFLTRHLYDQWMTKVTPPKEKAPAMEVG